MFPSTRILCRQGAKTDGIKQHCLQKCLFSASSKAGAAPPDLVALRGHITALEEEREENQWKVEHYEELREKSGKKNLT